MNVLAKVIVVQDADTLELVEVFGNRFDYNLWISDYEDRDIDTEGCFIVEERTVEINVSLEVKQ
jgi:hypothetical protein